MNSDERKMLADALKSYHDCAFTPGVYEHSIVGQAALILENYVEVVRCKDCKHLTVYNSPTLYAYCQKTHLRFEPFKEDTRTHFCSYGERKDNDL